MHGQERDGIPGGLHVRREEEDDGSARVETLECGRKYSKIVNENA